MLESSHQSFSSQWSRWMNRALQLASLADGETSPNPLVGAVVLDKNGKLVGEGFHSRAGESHAEPIALAHAAEAAKEGTLVVNLEPCCHHGKTPPCTESIIRSGIKQVVIALKDPDKRVSGKGISTLREAGIDVITGVMEKQASYQNRAFLFRVRTGRPWGILKWAMSLDGRVALPNGNSKWISNEQSRNWVYRLRSKCDAVIVGGETVRSDNPLLTSRGLSAFEPLRVVLTRSMKLPRKARLWDVSKVKTLVAYSAKIVDDQKIERPSGPDFVSLDPSEPLELMKELADRNCNCVLWECGPDLATQAIKDSCVQEVVVVLAPKLIGGLSSMSPLCDFGFTSMSQVFAVENQSLQKSGKDWIISASIDS